MRKIGLYDREYEFKDGVGLGQPKFNSFNNKWEVQIKFPFEVSKTRNGVPKDSVWVDSASEEEAIKLRERLYNFLIDDSIDEISWYDLRNGTQTVGEIEVIVPLSQQVSEVSQVSLSEIKDEYSEIIHKHFGGDRGLAERFNYDVKAYKEANGLEF